MTMRVEQAAEHRPCRKARQGGQHKQHVNNDGTTAAIDIMIG